MKLAIADPPYLGRGHRWYGGGRGHFKDRGISADVHPEAAIWDDPEAHRALVTRLVDEYDGWAIALSADSLRIYLEACPADVRVLAWDRGNGIPSGARVSNQWEPVIVYIPKDRRGRRGDLAAADTLRAGVPYKSGFVGRKPDAWTRWVLAVLGYRPADDELVDLFPGSGSVSAAADGMLAHVGTGSTDP